MNFDVSFVIPTYNAGLTLERTLASITTQKFAGTSEILLVDNNSTDGSVAKFKRLTSGTRIFRENHQGAASARNLGLRNARGKFVAFVDADVELEETWTQECLRQLESPWIDCAQTPIEPVGIGGTFMTRFRHGLDSAKTNGTFAHLHQAKETLPLANSAAVLIKRAFLETSGCKFDPALDRCEDLDFSLQLFAKGCNFSLVNSSRAFVSDHRDLMQFLKRSFLNGVYANLIRRFWRFPATSRSHTGFFGLQHLDRYATGLGEFLGRFKSIESAVHREIADRSSVVKVGPAALAPRSRMIFLPDATVLFELNRGQRRVLTNHQNDLFRRLLSHGLDGIEGREMVDSLINDGYLISLGCKS